MPFYEQDDYALKLLNTGRWELIMKPTEHNQLHYNQFL